jgi:hypothetical protein
MTPTLSSSICPRKKVHQKIEGPHMSDRWWEIALQARVMILLHVSCLAQERLYRTKVLVYDRGRMPGHVSPHLRLRPARFARRNPRSDKLHAPDKSLLHIQTWFRCRPVHYTAYRKSSSNECCTSTSLPRTLDILSLTPHPDTSFRPNVITRIDEKLHVEELAE